MGINQKSVDSHLPGNPLMRFPLFARGWSQKVRGLRDYHLLHPLLVLAGILLLSAVITGLTLYRSGHTEWSLIALPTVLLLLGIVTIIHLFLRINHYLLDPLTRLRDWVQSMRRGNIATRMPAFANGEFASLAQDVNKLADQLQILSQNVDAQVRTRMARISSKTRSLDILYEVVASLSTSWNREELLADFLETLIELLDAQAASVCLLTSDRRLLPAAVHGNFDEILTTWQLDGTNRSLCDMVTTEGRIRIHKITLRNKGPAAESSASENNPELIVVPIQYRNDILGVFILFLQYTSAELGDDFRDLLTSVGRHVGLALEKARLDENARRLAIMEERDILRNELHDSLAQSLLSTRLQVKMLGETLYKKDLPAAQNEVRQLHMGLEEAHTSLRELLASFRSKMDDRGLIPAIEDAVERFRQDTGITTFFQHECKELDLSPPQEVEVFRIVQEALANVRRHSRAQIARIFFSEDSRGNYRLLVEDDGIGIVEQSSGSRYAEHIGLPIMRERSQRLRGNLTVESESGEGTRVCLTFPSNKKNRVAAI